MNEMNATYPARLTVKEAADYLSLSRVSVYTLIKNQEITSVQFGKKTLINRTDIEEYEKRNTRRAKRFYTNSIKEG